MQERVKVPGLEAVVNAALSLGSNGRGKGGLGGFMFAMASQTPERFARLLGVALQIKDSAWGGGEAVLSDEQLMRRIEKMSVNEIVMEYAIHLVVPPLDDPPSSATDFVEAIIDSARRYGSNGRGKGGVGGYIRMLAEIGCKTFDKWIVRAMLEQVKGGSPRSIEEIWAGLRERGVERTIYDLAFVMRLGILPLENKTPKSELLEDLQLAHQYLNSRLREANPAPEGRDHDDHRETSEQQKGTSTNSELRGFVRI
jgi:hypothetical protein